MKRFLSPVPVIATLAVAALLGLLLYGVTSSGPDRGIEAALARGERPAAPDTRLPRLGAEGEGSLAEHRGEVVVLNYWASWCKPCRDESPLLQRWHERMSRRGGLVLGVDVLDTTSDAQRFVRDLKLTYPMLRDGPGETQKDFGVVAYPETVVVDPSGRITALRRGPVDEAFMQREVEPLLDPGT